MALTINNFSLNRQMNLKSGLKSTREKLARQEKCESQVNFWENQKKNLKNWEGATLEDIERKLDMFHSYEDQIDAAKMAYNNEQMWHMMDEAKERAEKLAEHLEETKPKTPEERKEDLVEEALGTDENNGLLSEILDDMEELVEDLESIEEIEQTTEMTEKEMSVEEMASEEGIEEGAAAEVPKAEAGTIWIQDEETARQEAKPYKRFDQRI